MASLSTKELREELKRLNVSTAGCLERQDLVDKLTSALQERGGAGSTPSASTCASNGKQAAYWVPRGASQSADVCNLSGSMSSPAVIGTDEDATFDFLQQCSIRKMVKTPGTLQPLGRRSAPKDLSWPNSQEDGSDFGH